MPTLYSTLYLYCFGERTYTGKNRAYQAQSSETRSGQVHHPQIHEKPNRAQCRFAGCWIARADTPGKLSQGNKISQIRKHRTRELRKHPPEEKYADTKDDGDKGRED